jgi:16S rRNA (guanine1516-N2)-methyltransferase
MRHTNEGVHKKHLCAFRRLFVKCYAIKSWRETQYRIFSRYDREEMERLKQTVGLLSLDQNFGRKRLKKLAAEFSLPECTFHERNELHLEVLSSELRLAGHLPGESIGRVLPVCTRLEELKTTVFRGGRRDMPLYRAVLGRRKPRGTRVLDLTGGLGQDAWLLAAFGCSLMVVEQEAVIFALLRDGVARAGVADQRVARRLRLIHASAQDVLLHIQNAGGYGPHRLKLPRPEVVYMDPFFSSERKRKGACKRSMQVLRFVANAQPNENISDLLDLGLQVATDRVVVKRPRVSVPFSTRFGPRVHSIQGRGHRFDIYK